ncbi:MAG: MATE family efflux transporter [Oscillospiraceae bacterium]|nr:MATE family efflux transporter [Oscillospiraceae bacterium]
MTPGTGKQTGDFTQGKIPAVIMGMAVPLIAAQLVNVLYNIVDRIYIGHIPVIGAHALTGVGVALPVITILSAFAGLFGQGGTPLFSIARGRGQTEQASRIMGNSMSLLLLSSAILAVIVRLVSRPVLLALGAGDNTLSYALDYLHIYLLGTPLVFITLGMNSYVNSQGFARRGMMTVMLGAVSNLLLDPLFIFVFDMGVRGAALATVLSQAVSASWCTLFLCSERAAIPLRRRYMGLRKDIVLRIMGLGVSNFMAQGTNSVIQAVGNRELALFGGELFIGAMTIINALRTAFFQVIMGVSAGMQPVIGYNYGASRRERVLECIRFTTFVAAGFMCVTWLLLELVPGPFVRIFTDDPELTAIAVPAVRIYYCAIFFMSLQLVSQSIFTGLGKARQAVFFSLFRKVVIEAPLMVLLPRWGMGAAGVFWSEPISDVVGGLAAFTAMLITVYFPLRRELRAEHNEVRS